MRLMSETLAVRDAKARLSELIARAARGEDIVITQDGHAVARLVSVQATGSMAGDDKGATELSAITTALCDLRGEVAAEGGALRLADILKWRDEGRH
jgi:prevent-host-death family protein